MRLLLVALWHSDGALHGTWVLDDFSMGYGRIHGTIDV